MRSPEKLLDRPGRGTKVLLLAIVVSVGFSIYSRTFDVPWYFDDYYAIVENPRVHDLGRAASGLLEPRWLTWLTFAMNIAVAGASLAGFHAVNLAIHLAAGLTAFCVLAWLFDGRRDLALLGALVFVAHPLQTQAVTYVVQRGASLAGFLCLLAVAFYLRFHAVRERLTSRRSPAAWGLYAAALVAGALAVSAKESAAVLPGLLMLLEIVAKSPTGRPAWRRLLRVLPFALVPALVALRSFAVAEAGPPDMQGNAGLLGGVSAFEPEAVGGVYVSPVAYFATELEVVWRYLRRVVLPYGQVFDFGLPIDPEPFRWTVLAGGLGVLLLLGTAWRLRRHEPAIAFGIGWFFVALAVESTFIPLDAYFEHRLYLPMFGVALITPTMVDRLLLGDRKKIATVGALLVIALAGLTLRRNEIWRDPVRLWRADLDHGSQSYRSAIGLADALHRRGDAQAAADVYRDFVTRAESRCRRLPCGARYLLNLGVALERLKEPLRAEDSYRRALLAQPSYAAAHYNLGVVLYESGRRGEALEAFRRAAELSPADASAQYNWAVVALELGDSTPAIWILEKLRRLSPELAGRLEADLSHESKQRPR